jgi:tetratricopeptide (TPR) repeat protein
MKSGHLRLRALATALSLLVAGLPFSASADELTQRARKLMDARDARGAYDLLAPQASARAGDPEFDYLLGIAAIDTGRNTEAVFALERVLAVQPNNAQARAEIARAYFNLRELEAAKREFENVKKAAPPAEVVSTVDRYLAAILTAAPGTKPTARFFVEGFAGYDTNVNSATADRSVGIPVFGGAVFNLASTASKLSDEYWGAAAGVATRMPVNERWALIAGVNGSRRWNGTYSQFDTSFLDFNAGVQHRRERDLYTLIGQYNEFTVYDPIYTAAYRQAAGGTAQWQRDLDARNQVSAYVQYAALDYPDQAVRNSNRWVVGAGLAHAYRSGLKVYSAGYLGTDQERAQNQSHIGYNLGGVRVGGDYPLRDSLLLFANAAYERRQYGGPDPFFLVDRADNQYTGSLGMHWFPATGWRVTPQVLGFRNDSNISINTFSRVIGEVRLRREF